MDFHRGALAFAQPPDSVAAERKARQPWWRLEGVGLKEVVTVQFTATQAETHIQVQVQRIAEVRLHIGSGRRRGSACPLLWSLGYWQSHRGQHPGSCWPLGGQPGEVLHSELKGQSFLPFWVQFIRYRWILPHPIWGLTG